MHTNKTFISISKKTLFFIIQSSIALNKKERNTSKGIFYSIKVAIVLSLFFLLWNLFTERFLNEKNYDCSKKRTKRDFKQHNSWLKIFILSEGSVSSSHCLLIKVIDPLFLTFCIEVIVRHENKLFICSFIVETASQISFQSALCFFISISWEKDAFRECYEKFILFGEKERYFSLKQFSLQRKTTTIVLFLSYPFECYEYSIFICVFLFNEQNISFIL